MNELAVMKWVNIACLSTLGVCVLLLLADVQRTGGWMWKKAPAPLNRITPRIHRLVMFVTLFPLGMVMVLKAAILATVPEAPNWLETAGRLSMATISLEFVACHPFTAALETNQPPS